MKGSIKATPEQKAALQDEVNAHRLQVDMDYNAQCIAEMNQLCDKFGCLPGMNRIHWIENQLKELNEIKRSALRSKLSSMVRGDKLKTHGWDVTFTKEGLFIVVNFKETGLQSPSVKAVVNHILGEI